MELTESEQYFKLLKGDDNKEWTSPNGSSLEFSLHYGKPYLVMNINGRNLSGLCVVDNKDLILAGQKIKFRVKIIHNFEIELTDEKNITTTFFSFPIPL